ncbi:NFACT family protein [Candidatus Woesearchaeota archaeon]|nr:NFACT family protein [Candidatus Woesearchaeota archaeon]
MKTNITSLELHQLVEEFQFLINSRVDNIYNPKKEELILQLYASGKGKQILRIISGKLIYLASSKPPGEEPSGFCMFLRKHLGNSRLKSVRQLGSERILEFVFEKAEKRRLIVEFFGKGNILLCDENNIILSALVYHKWKDREIRARLKYTYPEMQHNLFGLKQETLKELLKKTDKSLVKCLAADLGLGGVYSEEACLLAKVDKNAKPAELDEKEIKGIFKHINDLIKSSIKPSIVYKDNEVKDIIPFGLKTYDNLEKKGFSSYNEAFDYYFSNEFREEKPKTKHEKDLEKLKRRLEQQEQTIKDLTGKELKERKKADLIYQNYELVNNIILELRKAADKHGWKEIEKRLKGHKLVKSVNPKEKKVEIEVKE